MKLQGCTCLFILLTLSSRAISQTTNSGIPHLVQKNGRNTLIVDGEPFLMLGAQSNNSSTWLATLPQYFDEPKVLRVMVYTR